MVTGKRMILDVSLGTTSLMSIPLKRDSGVTHKPIPVRRTRTISPSKGKEGGRRGTCKTDGPSDLTH